MSSQLNSSSDPQDQEILAAVEPSAFVTEDDLAMYAAITGRRPVVEVVAQPKPSVSVGYLRMPENAEKGFRKVLASMHKYPKVTVMIRHFERAKQRISEAKYRLAG